MSTASEDFAHVEKLRGHSNFSIGKFQIAVLLKAADLYNVVSTEVKNGEQDTNWVKKEAKAQRYIVTAIDKCNIQFIMSYDFVKGMFDKLCSIYERDSSHNKSSLLQNFFNFKIDKVADRKNKSTTSNRAKVAFLTESMGGNPEGSWVLDSGCTYHMINNSDSLTNVTENGGVVKFTENGAEILMGRIKITDEDNTGLYNMNFNCSETTLLSESKQTIDLNLCHRIIEYLNVDSMMKLATLSSELEKLKFCTSEIQCETYLTSKKTRKQGIKIDYVPTATAQLNGRAERLNRVLMEKTRVFLFYSGLEKVLWGEALCTAMYLLNRNPSASVDTTPVEL
ncbi:hypothetical protein PR048_031727 [Dryococelus australis]|uniref:Integrase catalytic domain-containing protein n=1 Tax=Dryococelus australis TaxID=614101 RepID=A0ABQ9G6Q4_9NEOP|nr:hypothetical protein PR048_031727 [Dryococelus australis]